MAFYRSNGFRYVQIITGLVMVASLITPGQEQFRRTRSLLLLHIDYPPLAWLWAVIFAIYVALLVKHTPLTAELADWIGLFAGFVFASALLWTARWGDPFNWIATGFVIDGIAAHYAAARLAHFDRAGIGK